MMVKNNYFLGCNETECNERNHEICKQTNITRSAQCVCKFGFKKHPNGICKTRPKIYWLCFEITYYYRWYLSDICNSITVNFIKEMVERVRAVLNLSPAEADIVIKELIYVQRVRVYFWILLYQNTTATPDSIKSSLVNEISSNGTNMAIYYPESLGDVNTTVLVNGKV